ncbi:hypothetical protein SFRURICE_019541 [Spodoptera frugiperda]|nr:hypothetical protein SFRURICE_019541 [Spodoptera frugiperda]
MFNLKIHACRRFVKTVIYRNKVNNKNSLITGVTAGGGGWEPLGTPYFDNSTKREATAAVGQPAYLHCRVRNLADRAVRQLILNPISVKKGNNFVKRNRSLSSVLFDKILKQSFMSLRRAGLQCSGVFMVVSTGDPGLQELQRYRRMWRAYPIKKKNLFHRYYVKDLH